MLVFVGAIVLVALALGVVLTHKDAGMRCAEMGYDDGEQVCVQWETREGVRSRRIQ